MHGNTLVYVYEDKYFHERIRFKQAKDEGLTVAECALCDSPAVWLDHLFPNHIEMNRCKDHLKEPSPAMTLHDAKLHLTRIGGLSQVLLDALKDSDQYIRCYPPAENTPRAQEIAEEDKERVLARNRAAVIAAESGSGLLIPRLMQLTLVEAFVALVNSRAEEEMLRTGNIAGAHHRAIEHELSKLKQATDAEVKLAASK